MAKGRSQLSDQGRILVRPVWARMVALELKRQGADVEHALAETRLEWRTLNNSNAWIPFSAHAKLLEIAADATGDDCFGLHISEKIDIRDAGLLGYLGIASKTVEEGLFNLARYLRVFSEGFQIELKISNGLGTVVVIPQDPLHAQLRQAMEFAYCAVLHAYRHLTGKRITPVHVHFVHARRSNVALFTKHFGCPVKFNRNQGQIAFDHKVLATPIQSADDRLLLILRKHAEDLLEKRPKHTEELVHRIERRLTELLPTGQGRAKIIATELGMSERTLMRRLGKLNISFAGIVENLRKEHAAKYLAQESLSFTHIAFLLGYANQSAFSVACKRWTGKSPREVRAQRV